MRVPLFLTEIRLGGYKGIRKCKKGKVTEKVKIMQDKKIVIIDENKSSHIILWLHYMECE